MDIQMNILGFLPAELGMAFVGRTELLRLRKAWKYRIGFLVRRHRAPGLSRRNDRGFRVKR